MFGDCFVGYVMITIPILIILCVLFCPTTERFIDIKSLGNKLIDKFETNFFSPELNKIVKTEPLNAAPIDDSKENMPNSTNITAPNVCDATVMKCTDTKQVIGKPNMNPFNQKPYGDVPIGQLDYTGFRDLKKELQILKGAPKTLPGGASTAQCKFVGGDKCPEGYNLVGASIGISGSRAKLNCNVSTIDIPAILSTTVVNGAINRIIKVNGGRGYASNPAVIIQGTGQGAKARSFINDKGEIEVVEILDGGTGYTQESTTIIIDPNQDSDTCQLCCRA